MRPVGVREARREDFAPVKFLLESESLPIAGVEEHLEDFLVAEQAGQIVGVIGLEVYDETALLRSHVVQKGLQGMGIGSLLYNEVLRHATELGVRKLVLLTNTAEAYFAARGFKKIDAKSVNGPVTSSVEFTGACPSHAACMEMTL
jgi:amino-acid N-acetyltransferase